MNPKQRSILFLMLALAFYGLAIFLSHRQFVADALGQSHGLGLGSLLSIGAGTAFLVMGARKPRTR